MRFPIRLLSIVVAIVAIATRLPAEPSTPGALVATQADGATVEMPLRHTKVSIEVSAFVARATIEQEFVNPFTDPVEAVYTFPLGHGAAVDDFELVVGDRTIRGTIKRRDEARAVYEQARDEGFEAALLEQERPNVFTQSVANLEPGKPVTVRLRTTETVPYDRGAYRLTFPLVVGPRYIKGDATDDAAKLTPPTLEANQRSGHDVEIVVAIDAGVPLSDLQSPSHKTVVMKSSARGATVRLADDDMIPNKDFVLRWSVASDRPAVGLLAHRDGLDGFFTLLVQPKGEIGPAEATPKEITFVLDTSGSMHGIPIEASKRFAAAALRALGPRDTFNLIRFAGDNEVYAKSALPNDRNAVEAAIAWFQKRSGEGGTELLAAMRAAFAQPSDPNRLRVVIFLTDGQVGDDEEILAEIGKVLGAARIYTVGIGTDVNHYLLGRMASLGRGSYVVVRPDKSADDALFAFRSWVTLPYLTDLSIDWGALPIADVSPERLPDLGSGQTLSVVGRYLTAGEGNILVRGKLGGRYWEQALHVVLPERDRNNEALSSLWARARIDELLRDAGDTLPYSVEAEVTALALSYRLMSAFTSFVAVDDAHVANPSGRSRTVRQAVPMPEGASLEGIFGKDGPMGLRPDDVEAEGPEDQVDDTTVNGELQEFPGGVPSGVPGGVVRGVVGGVAGGVPVGVPSAVWKVDPLTGQFLNQVASDSVEAVVVVNAGAGAEYGRAQGGFAQVTTFSADFISDLPVAGRLYQNVLALAPGVQGSSGDGNPNVPGARQLEFTAGVPVGREFADDNEAASRARERLLDAAIRVLADLADDGKLSAAEGRPALAALLAAQRGSGAVAEDVTVQAVATWALAEAALRSRRDPWIAQASTKALDYLAGLSQPGGWPARAGGAIDADTTRWARLVLGSFRPASVKSVRVPAGSYRVLLAKLHSDPVGVIAGRSPYDRLVRTAGRGYLTMVKAS